MSSQFPGGEWYMRCAVLESNLNDATLANEDNSRWLLEEMHKVKLLRRALTKANAVLDGEVYDWADRYGHLFNLMSEALEDTK